MIRSLIFASAAFALFSCRAVEPAKASSEGRIAIVPMGESAAALAAHAVKWVEGNVPLKVELLPVQKDVGANLDEIAVNARKAAGTNFVRVVAVAMPPVGVKGHGMRTQDGLAAVVNVRAMQEDKPDATKLERRIERQVIRAIALLVNMPTCINRQCAISAYSDLADLDSHGRNLCPPCVSKIHGDATSAGVGLNPDSPFYIQK